MKPNAYYNENDEEKAEWLRELIRSGIVAAGEVDTRSITEVWPEDLDGFAQCHFFAGIGVWSYALRLASWPDDRPVWTGSCPCPSFSAAGKGGGFDDPRHLWPDWARLIRKRRPATIFGEQADDAIGYGWLDLVQTDLEREDYAVGKAVLGACSIGAPHIRQRLYFVAHAKGAALGRPTQSGNSAGRNQTEQAWSGAPLGRRGDIGNVADTNIPGSHERTSSGKQSLRDERYTAGFWADADWIYCRDECYRPVEPGTFPLAHGVASRMEQVRGYGDAICAEVAKVFIEAAK